MRGPRILYRLDAIVSLCLQSGWQPVPTPLF